MLRVINACIVLIAFITTTSCKIIIHNHHNENHTLDLELKDVQVLFGSDIPVEGIKGYIMSAIPEDGCKKISPPPNNETYFALIKKGNCSFDTKIRNAQNSNFLLAIIYNVKSDIALPFKNNNISDIFIPMIFVGENTGGMLKKYLGDHHGFYVIIMKNKFSLEINWKLLMLPFALFIIIIPVLFFAVLGVMTAKWIKKSNNSYNRRLPATNTYPISLFFKGCPYDTCVICLDDYVEGDKLQVMQCNHAYHSECIKLWLLQKKFVCPICKRQVVYNNEEPFGYDYNEPHDRTPLVTYRIN